MTRPRSGAAKRTPGARRQHPPSGERARAGRLGRGRLAPLLLGLTAACGPEFDPYARLSSLRVLALRSEPPTPGAGETATLDALVYAPPEEGAPVTPVEQRVDYRWSWCLVPGPASEGHPCLVEPELFGLSSDLGSGPTATLPTFGSLPPAEQSRVRDLCAGKLGTFGLPIDAEGYCDGGFPIQVKLVVRAPRGEATPSDEVTAVRNVRLRFDDSVPPSRNPRLGELEAEVGGAWRALTPPFADASVLLLLPRNTNVPLKAGVVEDPTEAYRGEDLEGRPADVQERLFTTWFVESGEVEEDRRSANENLDPPIPIAQALQNKWKPAVKRKYDRATSRVYVVIRDERGGVGWIEREARLEETP
jgi:hypothetical protein